MPGLGRAYSFIEIKAIEEDTRIIRGTATTPAPDRMRDIVNPLGAKFDLPIPHLWQHNHDQPIGHVIEATPKATGIPFVSQIAKTDEPGMLKDLLDMAWQSMKMRLVRAVSIGFQPLKYAFLDDGGIEFEEWSWYELSSVTIPAQPEATITSVKAIDRAYREAAGVPDFDYPEGAPGDAFFDLKAARAVKEIPSPPEPAAIGKQCRVVRLNDQPASRQPFIIREIRR